MRLPRDPDYWCAIPGHGNVRPFLIGRYPVTVWEYAKFVEAGGAVPDTWDDQFLHQSRPVVKVSWDDAKTYCDWAKCRLPTEQEWQLAAQGSDGREYPWGREDPDRTRANIGGWVGAPTPVGMFPGGLSPHGCHDMSGNVWEWTDSWYGEKKGSRTVRGGSWVNSPAHIRCVARYYERPASRYSNVGFRVARTK